MKIIKYLAISIVLIVISGTSFLYSGIYPMGADVAHSPLTYWALETMREKSIARAARNIEVPKDLMTPKRLLAGGLDYNDMCASCHLKPGKAQSDLSIGLYPRPPNLAMALRNSQALNESPRAYNELLAGRQFWIIKHGIKASGMPAWGVTHDDQRIWNMVAFIQKLPQLSGEQYQILTSRGEDDAD